MNTICGWYAVAGDSPGDRSRAMIKAMLPQGKAETVLFNTHALACSSSGKYHDYAEQDGCHAVIAGLPWWPDDQLNTIARDRGPAEALIRAWRERGKDCLQALRGRFACAIIEPGKQKLLLAIDRLGNESLYYYLNDANDLFFSSRARSLYTISEFERELNQQALYDYLYFHAIPSPETIYTGMSRLAPGHCLYLDNGSITSERYWAPDFSKSNASLEKLEQQVQGVLRHAIKRSLSDQQVGAFLSGGVDSSTVSGLLSEVSDLPAKTFSIGFDAEEYNEIEYARLTTSHFKTEQHEYFVTPQDVVDIVPRIAGYYDEPFGNSSAVPVYYCAKLAKDHGVNLMLAGDGGDELFAGNVRYRKQQIFGLYDNTPGFIKCMLDPLVRHFPGGRYIMPVRKARSYIDQARVPMPERLETYNMLHHFEPAETFNPDFLTAVSERAAVEHMNQQYYATQSKSMLDRMLFLDWKQTLADNDLRKVNGMCDLAGIDVNYPLLDDELLDFSMTVPDKLKIRGNQLRFFFKHAMRNFLPQGVLTKSKHGFGLPFGVWMRTYKPLQELAYDSITALKQRRMLKNEFLDQLIKLHREDHAAFYGEFIWVLMMLELWLRSHQH